MFSKYRKESVESGVKFVEGAPIMTSRYLSYICRKCLMDQNFELRCFFLMDKFGVGRCTEVSCILLASFHSLLNHLMLRVHKSIMEQLQRILGWWWRCSVPMHRRVSFEDRNYRWPMSNAWSKELWNMRHSCNCKPCMHVNQPRSEYLSETGNHVINMELARIEQQWRVDSDAEKPGKFTKDMTSHSIRKLAKNILARETKLPEQYADLRAGLSRKYNNTIDTYISHLTAS